MLMVMARIFIGLAVAQKVQRMLNVLAKVGMTKYITTIGIPDSQMEE